MRVAVIGAGIVGVTSAFELAHDGHEVTVFERRGGVAAEGSFANAGVLAPGYVTPWAGPGMPRKLLRHCLSRHAPLRIGGRLGPGGSRWLWQWWRSCGLESYERNRARMHRLAHAGRNRRLMLTRLLHLDVERCQGYLVLLRREEELQLARPGLKLLADLGVRHELLDGAGCRAIEPGLNPTTPLHAGIHVIDDEVANCRQFAQAMRREAETLGARFRFHTDIVSIEGGSKPVLTWTQRPPQAGDRGPTLRRSDASLETSTFDAVVVCAALDSRQLLAPLGLKLPLLAVHGYSITAPLRETHGEADPGPRSGVMDERYKVSLSRIGNRLRVAGSAEIGGSLDRNNPAALATLRQVLDDWFPGSARMSQAQFWKGARPMLPDGPPVIGPSGVTGVWLNLGHGSSGWAMANGSARLLADLVSGRPASIDPEGLGIERLSR